MKNAKKAFALAILCALTVFSFVTGLKKETPPRPSEQNSESGKTYVPDFTIYDGEGGRVKFSDFQGKPVVINFWATWCPFCVKELPDFDKAAGKYGEKVNFLFIDVADGKQETVEKAKEYLAEQDFENITSYYDSGLEASDLFGISSLPMTLLIDSDGRMYGYFRGATSYDSLTQAIDDMIAEGED